ncbi:fructose-bisphosphatase [Methylobacterium oryzihabitans]|uniref:fructose-bisphosphatase n=1 Tax=Methylobacterium oryzihabitans TaxID=2499852 RepID=A0A437P6B1_9HYPH|nr:fructose-bisphosphatase [Methylobacterium oryzihabitans]RVU17752.1 fructose-bisphosphatase [Methylobacterium oryzihabitans]
MTTGIRLTTHLAQDRAACASGSAPVLAALAAGAAALVRCLARDPEPSDLDALARRTFADALAAAPLAALSLPGALPGAGVAPGLAGTPVAVALTPLDAPDDGAAGLPAGTLFSLRPVLGRDPAQAVLAPGREQCAAGLVTYGARTVLILTHGGPAWRFVLDPEAGEFRLAGRAAIPPEGRHCTLDPAAARHWAAPVRAFVEACRAGSDGPRGHDVTMDWCASLAAGAGRVLARGGLHLRPAEPRRAAAGTVSLVHAAAAVAGVVEAAGGRVRLFAARGLLRA